MKVRFFMNIQPIKILLSEDAQDLPLPCYQTAGAAGADIHAAIHTDIILMPQDITLIPTGLHLVLPDNIEAQIRPRSGLAIRSGVTVINAPGTIDSDYRGEIKVGLINLGKAPVTINRGMRIAQMVLAPVFRADFEKVSTIDETERGAGGFGSTGLQLSAHE